MSASGQLIYDPLAVFLAVFSDPGLAADLAVALDCREVNVLIGLLESHSRSPAAALWLTYHLRDCDTPARHLH